MEKGAKKNTADFVRSLVEGAVEGAGYALWDVLFYKEGSEWTLELQIDRAEGISLTDCERVTKLVDPILDEADPVEGGYVLEVSSAGTERTLRQAEQFSAYLGKEVTATLYAPLNGTKEITGTLNSCQDGDLLIGETGLKKGQYAAVKTVDTTTLS